MPLFFLLAGLVYKDRGLGVLAFVKRQLRTRLVPAWAFTFIGMLAWGRAQLTAADFGYIGEHGWAGLAQHCVTRTLTEIAVGRPTFNVLMWFLVCLVVVEVWQYLLQPLIRTTLGLALSIACFAGLTALVALHRPQLETAAGYWVNWWHMTSAIAAMFFYQLGILIQRSRILQRPKPALWEIALGLACLLTLQLTFGVNQPAGSRIVMLAGANYGSPGWFFLSSLTGIFFVMILSRVVAGVPWLAYVGRMSLGLMCLDGLLHDYVNPAVATSVSGLIPITNIWLTAAVCTLGTLLSLAVCIPGVLIVERYTPYLLGKPARPSWRAAKPAI